jgi:UDP-glucose 4-epimerase
VRLLITGGAGYIGSHAVREFRDAGHEVAVLDDLSKGHRAAVPRDVPFVNADLADPDGLRQALVGAEAVVHFAGVLSVGESVRLPARYYQINVVKGLALLDAMVASGVRKIIFSSTCATYGMPVRVPMDETHPQDPINPYGASKRAFERALLDYSRAGLLRAVALRYFNAAGCHPDGTLGEDHDPEEHIIPLSIDAALGRRPPLTIFGNDYDTPDGTCIRDYIHVTDLARAHLLALKALEPAASAKRTGQDERGGASPRRVDDDSYKFYNLGTETGSSVSEVVSAVARVCGKPVPAKFGDRRPGDPPRLVASAAKIRTELGWRPQYGELEVVIDSALRWRRDHPQGWRIS